MSFHFVYFEGAKFNDHLLCFLQVCVTILHRYTKSALIYSYIVLKMYFCIRKYLFSQLLEAKVPEVAPDVRRFAQLAQFVVVVEVCRGVGHVVVVARVEERRLMVGSETELIYPFVLIASYLNK